MDKPTDRLAGAVDRGALAAALHTWRTGAELLAHAALAEDWPAYERAVAAVVAGLDRFDSIAELVGHYQFERQEVARATAVACQQAAPGRPLLAAVVADAAFWRRCRALVAAAVAG
jgi:hypothetical protein